MKNQTNISFVVPAYNSAKTLVESIDSIFDGNFVEGDEVIIIDDHSTDSTPLICRELSEKYHPNVKIIYNTENRGCPASRNVGIRDSKNEYIFNLDSDNILPPGAIQKLRDSIVVGKTDLVSFQNYHYFRDDISKISHRWICKSGRLTLPDLFSGLINPAPGGNFLYRKSMWSKVGGYWEYGKGLHEAWGYSFKLLINNAIFIVVPDTFYYHRFSHKSLFVRENKKHNESINVTNRFIKDSLNIFSDQSILDMQRDPDWFNHLEKHSLTLRTGDIGTNGKNIYTSKVRQILYLTKKIFI